MLVFPASLDLRRARPLRSVCPEPSEPRTAVRMPGRPAEAQGAESGAGAELQAGAGREEGKRRSWGEGGVRLGLFSL